MRAHLYCIAFALLMVTSCKKDVTPTSGTPPGTGDNKPPVANAGPDQTIMVPRDNVRLSGALSHDPDGGRLVYKWTTVAGPNAPGMDRDVMGLAPHEKLVADLKEGVYQFELMVMDHHLATSRDTVKVTVLPDALTVDPSRIKRFDNLYWEDSCILRVKNISSSIPANRSIQVYLVSYYGTAFSVLPGGDVYCSGWFPLQPVRSSSFWYEIRNDVLIVHAAASIVCHWDNALYDVLIRWN